MSFEGIPSDLIDPPRISWNGLGRLVNGNWHCDCNIPAVHRTTRKDGPNKGAKFWRCSQSREGQCSFFLWDDHEAQAKAWLEVSQPDRAPRSPISAQKGAEVDHRHRSMNADRGDHPMLPQNLSHPFTEPKRKTMANESTDSNTDNDSRAKTLEGDGDSFRNTTNADGPPRKMARVSPEVGERGGPSLPTPHSRDHRSASSRSLAELRRAQLRDTSPTPSRFVATNSAILAEESDLTTRIVALIRSDNPDLKITTQMQLQHEIDLELDLSAATLLRYENTIGTLYKRVAELETELVASRGESD